MIRSILSASGIALLLLASACKKDGDDGTAPPPAENSGLGRFHGAWQGSATRSDGYTFPAEARFNYRKDTDEVIGQMDLDGIWDTLMVLDQSGSYTLTGVPIVDGNPDTLFFTDVEFADDTYQTWSANWQWDSVVQGVAQQYLGTVSVTKYDLNAQ